MTGEFIPQTEGWLNSIHFKKNKRPGEDSAHFGFLRLKEFKISN